MSPQQFALAEPNTFAPEIPTLPVRTHSRRNAPDRLKQAFKDSKILTILVGEVKSSTSLLVGRFLAGIDDDVTVVRVTGPYSDEISVMREVINRIGFEWEDLSLNDLENVFTMFLSFQKSNNHRTLLCIDDVQGSGDWLLDRIRCLVKLETKKEYGLSILVSGRPGLNDFLNNSYLASLGVDAEQRIALTPFTLAETREYIKSRIVSSGTSDIAQVFEFDAITVVHELSDGAEDAVSNLYSRCLDLANEECTTPITADMVRKADELLREPQITQHSILRANSLEVNEASTQERRLIVRVNEESVQELPLNGGHILIGRDKLCNIRINRPSVSRHHALIVNSPDGVTIIDMASTNGTFVDGRLVKHYDLLDSGVIMIGDCILEYVASNDRHDWQFDIDRPDNVEAPNANNVTQSLNRDIKGNISSKGEKIYHVLGTASYNLTKVDESKGERWFRSEQEAVAAGWRAARR
jgi:type II secretory pathway predicted ATPase ExeA